MASWLAAISLGLGQPKNCAAWRCSIAAGEVLAETVDQARCSWTKSEATECSVSCGQGVQAVIFVEQVNFA